MENNVLNMLGNSRVVYFDIDTIEDVSTSRVIDVRGKTRRSSISYKKIVLDMLGSKTERLTVIYGNAGSGKSQFVRQFFNELDHEKWEAHILDISTKMDANQLLQSILDCNLTNANKNARANPSGKSTLILLNNFSNLRSREWNCPFELLRSLLDSKTIRNIDGEEIILPSVHFLAESTTSLSVNEIQVPERFRHFIYPVCWQHNRGDQNPKLIWRAYMNLSSDKVIKQALFNEANCAIRGIEGDLAKLCTKHLDEISILFKTMKFSSANKNVFAFMLEDVNSVEIVTSADVEFKIKELVKNGLKGLKENEFLIHDFNARHALFLFKVLHLHAYANCVHIGTSEMSHPICAFVATVSNISYERLPTHLTSEIFEEILKKV
uniref:Uncharacterized protein n=1 Tax=Acrobeloides nanus TaxID=290746 RepID=A0A914CTX5_9BILA